MGAKMVDVFNKDDAPYTELFQEKEITVPARGTIRMNRREALNFLGQISKPLENGGYVKKALEIREIPEESGTTQEATSFVCNLDGQHFNSKAELDAHLRSHADKVMKKKE